VRASRAGRTSPELDQRSKEKTPAPGSMVDPFVKTLIG
jgi:hypothetical protein